MQKFILFFILSLVFVTFCAFLMNSYILQKNYFDLDKSAVVSDNKSEQIVEVSKSIYQNYKKLDYDIAISEKRPVVLFFTSNWCLECSKQDSINKEAFSEIELQGVLGLNVHILDSETTTETDALAKKFDVTKENTFVFIDQLGAVSIKYVGELTKEQLISNILKVGDTK